MNLTPTIEFWDDFRPLAGVVEVDGGPILPGRPCEVASGFRFCDVFSDDGW